MKQVLFFFSVLFTYHSLCSAVDIIPLTQAIEEQNVNEIISYFDAIDGLSSQEADQFIQDIYSYYANYFGDEAFEGIEYLGQLKYAKRIYDSIFQRATMFEVESKSIKWFTKKKTKKNLIEEQQSGEIPVSMAVGGVEILAGALLWVIPYPGARQLGTLMMADGMRRVFNGAEEAGMKN